MTKKTVLSGLISMLVFAVCLWTQKAGAIEITRKGEARAVIVRPQKPSVFETWAADDLQHHIAKASGAMLDIVEETTDTSLAKIVLQRAPDMEELKALGRNGFIIRTVGNDLYIYGSWESIYHGVCYFLENQMGVRWIWPGELGEVVPENPDLIFENLDIAFRQPIQSSRIHPSNAGKAGWQNLEAYQKFTAACSQWYNRMGFSWDMRVRSQHAYGHPGWKYGHKYMKSHPEYFNLLPDGTRRPDPYHVCGGSPDYVSICPSSQGLIDQVLKDWKEKRAAGYPFGPSVYIGENDTAGSCCCEECLKADRSEDTERLKRAKARFEAKDPGWVRELGDVSERYAAYYMRVLEQAQKIDPNADVVAFCVYANYCEPPKYTKLNEHVILNYVGRLMYPWTQEKIDNAKRLWKGWHDAGATMVWRPNFMLDGHNMPINFARKFHDLYTFCLANGMIGTEFDSDIGQFGGNGFNYYVMARMIRTPGLTYEQLQDEYCSAFGGAKEDIRQYLDYWETISDSKETVDVCSQQRLNPVGVEVGGWNTFFAIANIIFTPEILAKGFDILNQAAEHAKGDVLAERRVKFLRDGLENARLTTEAENAYETGDKYKLAEAVATLDAFRKEIEPEFVANMMHLTTWENSFWDRESLKFMLNAPGTPMLDGWTFAFDPEHQGIENQWFAPDFDAADWEPIGIDTGWELQPMGKRWTEDHNNQPYDGFGWYRRTFQVAPEDVGRKAILTFGAVDESCKIWVNGKQLLDRPYPFEGDLNSWRTSFTVDITDVLKAGDNLLAVEVGDTAGQGGIWRPVWLKFEKTAVDVQENVVKNAGFETRGGATSDWPSHGASGKFDHGFDDKEANSGKHSYFMTCLGINAEGKNAFEKSWMRIFQGVTLNPETAYLFQTKVKTSPDYDGMIMIWIRGEELEQNIAVKGTNGVWLTLEMPEFKTAANTKSATIFLNTVGATTGTIWFDDVVLAPVKK